GRLHASQPRTRRFGFLRAAIELGGPAVRLVVETDDELRHADEEHRLPRLAIVAPRGEQETLALANRFLLETITAFVRLLEQLDLLGYPVLHRQAVDDLGVLADWLVRWRRQPHLHLDQSIARAHERVDDGGGAKELAGELVVAVGVLLHHVEPGARRGID